MSGIKRWRDSGHYEAAVETAGGEEQFLEGVQRLKDEAQRWRLGREGPSVSPKWMSH
jgi:hypothetical protein